MKKKLLTLADLYNFYSSKGKSVKFNAKDDDHTIVVQIDGQMKFSERNNNQDGLLAVTLHACHTEDNRNGSVIPQNVMSSAMASFKNRPILGYIYYNDVTEQYEFHSHDFTIDDNGEVQYEEFPIGIIPESCNAHLEYDMENGKNYVVVDGYIFDEYSKAGDILRREQELYVSVELNVKQLSYDANKKKLQIDDFLFSGVTILGKNYDGSDVEPGMENARINIKDFSKESNSIIPSDNKLIEVLGQLNDTLSHFNKNLTKGEKPMFDETREVESTEQEAVEQFDEAETPVVDENTDTEVEVDATEEDNENEVNNTEDVVEDETTEESEEETEPEQVPNVVERQYEKTISFTAPNGKVFELSMNEKIHSLYELVNTTYGDEDWYQVEAYDNYVIMHGFFYEKHYSQSYVNNDGVFSLDGDRTERFAEYLTQEELDKVNQMRQTYDSLLTYKESHEKAEMDAARKEVIDQYMEQLEDNDEFNSLIENQANYSIDELTFQCNAILGKQTLQFAKNDKPVGLFGKVNNVDSKKVIGMDVFFEMDEKEQPYGGLFEED